MPGIKVVSSGYVISSLEATFVNVGQKVDTENNILDQIEHYGSKCQQLPM